MKLYTPVNCNCKEFGLVGL